VELLRNDQGRQARAARPPLGGAAARGSAVERVHSRERSPLALDGKGRRPSRIGVRVPSEGSHAPSGFLEVDRATVVVKDLAGLRRRAAM
jgi:hypothetical protein